MASTTNEFEPFTVLEPAAKPFVSIEWEEFYDHHKVAVPNEEEFNILCFRKLSQSFFVAPSERDSIQIITKNNANELEVHAFKKETAKSVFKRYPTGKRTSIFDSWIGSRECRIIDSVVFNPYYPPGFSILNSSRKRIYNRWTNFSPEIFVSINPSEESEAEFALCTILFHLKEVICRNEETIYEFVLEWIASIVQKPWEKQKTVPVCCGQQGAGKSIWWENFSKIFGLHGLVCPTADLITHKFFADLSNKVFVVVNETNFEDRRERNNLKNQITSDFRKSEKKYENVRMEKDFVSMVWTSNEINNSFPAEKGSNRRYLCVQSDPSRAEDETYFTRLVDAFNSQNSLGLRALFRFLNTRILGSIDLRKTPHTEEKGDTVRSKLGIIDVWWLQCLEDKYHHSVLGSSLTDPRAIQWVTQNASKFGLFDHFKAFLGRQAKAVQNKSDWTQASFDLCFKSMIPPLDEQYEKEPPFSSPSDLFCMPSHSACAEYFKKFIGICSVSGAPTVQNNRKRKSYDSQKDESDIRGFFRRTRTQ